ncbi:hypothetical protein [Candidatus Poriferisodalis sp.]
MTRAQMTAFKDIEQSTAVDIVDSSAVQDSHRGLFKDAIPL